MHSSPENNRERPVSGHRRAMYDIIFGHESALGKYFDILLLLAIVLSVLAVMLESVGQIRSQHHDLLRSVEWFFTGVFTLEYFARIYCTDRPKNYIFSFFGIVDLLAVVPTYLSLVLVGSHYFIVIRTLRILRMFRILKMTRFIGESDVLLEAMLASRHKITVFIIAVVNLVLIIGALMHLIEGPESGFTSIPISVYWAIVTLTTVGYGDIAPETVVGQMLASVVMVLGYGIIAVPTGIVTAELSKSSAGRERHKPPCPLCQNRAHDADAKFCKSCGVRVFPQAP